VSRRHEPGRQASSRANLEPSAEAQIRRSDTSEPLGKPPVPSRTETIYASRRACCRACVEPSAEAQIRRSDTSEPSGKLPGPSPTETIYTSRLARRRTCVKPSTVVIRRVSHWVSYQVREPAGNSNIEPNPLDYSL